jgi:small conductance mechanosensitive channel
MAYGPNLILAILTLVIGLWVIKAIVKALARAFEKKEYDPSLETFILSLTRIVLKVLLVISVVGMLGVQMTSFIAILGAAGLAVGLALSGTLQNFAGGVMILIFKPFKVGDVLEAQGFIGSVKAIQIFNTILKTPDNKTIILPNAPLSAGSMVNYSTELTRRVDLTFGIGYDDDIDQAKAAIQALVDADDRILKDPAPFIAVSELADSSVNFVVRLWVNSTDYWGVHFDMIEAVKKEFDRRNISIPYPQQDVHMHTVGPAA